MGPRNFGHLGPHPVSYIHEQECRAHGRHSEHFAKKNEFRFAECTGIFVQHKLTYDKVTAADVYEWLERWGWGLRRITRSAWLAVDTPPP